MTTERAEALAERLDLDLHGIGICLPCLTFVAFPLDNGTEAEVRRRLNEFTPILWQEGLALPAQAALASAVREGIPDAAAALDDAVRCGSRAPIARAIVRRLAADMVSEMRHDFRAVCH